MVLNQVNVMNLSIPTMSNVQYFVVVPKKQYVFVVKNVGTIDQPFILVEESSLPFDLTPFYASDRVQLYEASAVVTLTWDHARFELVSSIVNATDQLFGYTSSTTYSNYRARLHQAFTRYFRNEAEH